MKFIIVDPSPLPILIPLSPNTRLRILVFKYHISELAILLFYILQSGNVGSWKPMLYPVLSIFSNACKRNTE